MRVFSFSSLSPAHHVIIEGRKGVSVMKAGRNSIHEYGSEEEAIVYVWRNGHLWEQHQDFLAGS